jgi:hypothetical protein
VVSFAYPLFPALFIVVGLWMTVRGVQLKPYVSLAAVLTVATGAAVYHFRMRSSPRPEPVVETY